MANAVKTQPWVPKARARREVAQVLVDLCARIPDEPHEGRGPKPIPMGDVVYHCAMKIHYGVSGREYKPKTRPHYNTLFGRMGDRAMTQALADLLYVWRHVKPTVIPWGPATAKADTAKVNEKLLRELLERAATVAKGEL